MTAAAINDLERLNFLQALGRSGLPLSAWEQGFLADFRQSSRPSLWFTNRRRQAADRMRRAHGDLAGPPTTLNAAPPSQYSSGRMGRNI